MKNNISNQVLTFELQEKLIMSNSDATKNVLKKDIDELTKKNSIESVIIDLKNVDFIDSTGVGVFISIYKFLVEKNLTLKLVHPQEIVSKVLTITKLSNIIDIEN